MHNGRGFGVWRIYLAGLSPSKVQFTIAVSPGSARSSRRAVHRYSASNWGESRRQYNACSIARSPHVSLTARRRPAHHARCSRPESIADSHPRKIHLKRMQLFRQTLWALTPTHQDEREVDAFALRGCSEGTLERRGKAPRERACAFGQPSCGYGQQWRNGGGQQPLARSFVRAICLHCHHCGLFLHKFFR